MLDKATGEGGKNSKHFSMAAIIQSLHQNDNPGDPKGFQKPLGSGFPGHSQTYCPFLSQSVVVLQNSLMWRSGRSFPPNPQPSGSGVKNRRRSNPLLIGKVISTEVIRMYQMNGLAE